MSETNSTEDRVGQVPNHPICLICREEITQDLCNLGCNPRCSSPNYHTTCISEWFRTSGKRKCISCTSKPSPAALAQIELIGLRDQMDQVDQVDQVDDQVDQINRAPVYIDEVLVEGVHQFNPLGRRENADLSINIWVFYCLMLFNINYNLNTLKECFDGVKFKFNILMGVNFVSLYFVLIAIWFAYNQVVVEFGGLVGVFPRLRFVGNDNVVRVKRMYGRMLKISCMYCLVSLLLEFSVM